MARPTDHVIIREVYEDESTTERFEARLEKALQNGEKFIIIEPIKLGKDIQKFIYVGNIFHKTAVTSSLFSLTVCYLSHVPYFPEHSCYTIALPLAMVGWISTGVYNLTWQFDPCSKYQVLQDRSKLSQNAVSDLHTTSPVVLERKDDTVRKMLHNLLALSTASFFAYRFYDWYVG